MTKIYIASRMHHAPVWRNLYALYPDIHVESRWPFLEPFIDPTPANAAKFWEDDLVDISHSDYLIVYAESGEKLRGALVEAGMALALGIPVLLIGDSDSNGTWQHLKLVKKFPTLEAAINYIREA